MYEWLQSARTLASGLRTAFYGLVAVWLGISEAQASVILDAVVVGGLLADYTTWFIRTIALLPAHIYHGIYDSAVNIAFALFLVNVTSFDPSLDGEGYAMGTLAFVIVLVIKSILYTFQLARYSLGDD